METTPSQGLPDSYEFSQSQFTQTQPQTQPDTQPHQAVSTSFPPHLWGYLISSTGETSSNLDPNARGVGGVGGESLDRPSRFDFVRPAVGGKLTYAIGRHPKNDLRLNSPKVSNNHARITISDTDGLIRLEDLSTNGTYVRNIKVNS
jgi:hypothetical protein